MPTAAKGQVPSTVCLCGPAGPTTDSIAAEQLAASGDPSFRSARHTHIRRRPEQTVLHQVVREHLETFLAETRLRGTGEGLPRFVERELREFLTCGVMARGFPAFATPAASVRFWSRSPARGVGFARLVLSADPARISALTRSSDTYYRAT
jgi:hypothetical protein